MLRLIDLFCGCGGMTLGFVQTGAFTPVFADDIDAAAMASYRANFDPRGEHSVLGDLEALLRNGLPLPAAEVVIGGPPCQGFSLLNRKRAGDPRQALWRPFLAAVDRCGAEVIVMENVPQLLSSAEYHLLKEEMRRMGFDFIRAAVLDAADYGVPQRRRRAIILAAKRMPIELPLPTHGDPALAKINGLLPWRTVRQAIADLPEPVSTEIGGPPPLNLHVRRTPTPESLERYRAVPEGGNRFDLQRNRPDLTPRCWRDKPSGGVDVFGRLWWDRPSVTIRTEFYKPEKGRYLHPEQHRPITHREAARLQSFPDEFVFMGSKAEIARQIGNAVPPLLAKAIAEQVREAFLQSA
ncbi:MAG: DNA cytosine methyltransferase [candidate division KSB1 bacterium]|nr:DNA cytosine methyltransferase [candidate division KSB1 bacterium]